MSLSINPLFLMAALVVLISAVGGLLAFFFGGFTKPTGWSLALAVAPSSVLLVLFYTLALHMHQSLGGWPSAIGEQGFPPGLMAHVHATIYFFMALFLGTLFVWPVAFLACSLVGRWRRSVIYLSLHALAFALCVGLMQLAPDRFLYWWQD